MIERTAVNTLVAKIYLGLKVRATGEQQAYAVAKQVIQGYVNDVGLCVSVSPIDYIYTGGSEEGLVATLINYPRFPSTGEPIAAQAMRIAEMLMVAFRQCRASVLLPTGDTVMLTDTERSE